jgi:hypothetical protein
MASPQNPIRIKVEADFQQVVKANKSARPLGLGRTRGIKPA